MSVTSSARSARAPLSQSVTHPASSTAKGHRVIRTVRPVTPVASAQVPQPGLLGRLWGRLCAALRVTPEQMDAQSRIQHAGQRRDSGDGSPRVAMLSGGGLVLLPRAEAAGPPRFAQPDLR